MGSPSIVVFMCLPCISVRDSFNPTIMPLNPFQRAKQRPRASPSASRSLLSSDLTLSTRESPILIDDAPEWQGSEETEAPAPAPRPGNATSGCNFTIKWEELRHEGNILEKPRYRARNKRHVNTACLGGSSKHELHVQGSAASR